MSFAALLAKEYGWKHEIIMRQPFGLVLAYAHAAQVMGGACMRWVAGDEGEVRHDLEKLQAVGDYEDEEL